MAAPLDEFLIIEEASVLESRIDTRDAYVFQAHHVFGRLNVPIDLGGTLHQVSSHNPGWLRGFILCRFFQRFVNPAHCFLMFRVAV